MTYFADRGKDMLEVIRAPAIFEHFVDATGMDVSNYRKILAMVRPVWIVNRCMSMARRLCRVSYIEAQGTFAALCPRAAGT